MTLTGLQRAFATDIVCGLLPIEGTGPNRDPNSIHRKELLDELTKLTHRFHDGGVSRRIYELRDAAHRNGDTALGLACDFVIALGENPQAPQKSIVRALLNGIGIRIGPASTPTEPGWYLAKAKPSWLYPDGEPEYVLRQVVQFPHASEVELVVPEENDTYCDLNLFDWGAKVI